MINSRISFQLQCMAISIADELAVCGRGLECWEGASFLAAFTFAEGHALRSFYSFFFHVTHQAAIAPALEAF
jgi:hypothetical protein